MVELLLFLLCSSGVLVVLSDAFLFRLVSLGRDVNLASSEDTNIMLI